LKRPLLLAASAVFAASVLTGCGGAPSEAEIKAALDREIDREIATQAAMAREMMGSDGEAMVKNMMPVVQNLKKLGCKPDGNKAYLCDVEAEVSMFGVTEKSTSSVRLVKGSDGWAITQ